MKKLTSLLIAALVSGCGTFGSNTMSAEQIAASAKAKDANVVCVKATGPWGAAVTTYVNVDKDVVKAGGVSVDAECKVTYSNAPALPAGPVR